MHAKSDEARLSPELEREYETEGLFGPDWGKEWVDEIRRREAEPAFSETIDADDACALARALLRFRG